MARRPPPRHQPGSPTSLHEGDNSRRLNWVLACALIAGALVTYWPVGQHEFINFDDPAYVTENVHVTDGLTAAGVRWAFTSGHAGNWHPLTWLSHMTDVELFGVQSGRHHLVNVALHVLSAVLLFWLFLRLTQQRWPSVFVAGVFAVHPLHVESVAWIAERKDVLSACLFMLTLHAYVSYVRRPQASRYMVLITVFALGLMAKPMVVTTPFVLLLLDYWPLKRLQRSEGWRAVVAEKLPLVAMAAASSAVTYIVQSQAGAVRTFDVLPFSVRLANAVVSYVGYLVKAFWPAALAPIYPYPLNRSWLLVAGAALLIGAITTVVILLRRSRPYLAVGWFWFIGMLVPVIGLIQVGSQPIADRYAYLPLVGISVAVAWGLRGLVAGKPVAERAVSLAAAVAIVALAVVAHRQVTYWRTSEALWQHAIAVVPGNYRAHANLGQVLAELGQYDAAIAQEREAIRIKSDFADAHHYLGSALLDAGKVDEAVVALREALRLRPRYVAAHNSLGLALAAQQKSAEAAEHFEEARRLSPDFAPAHGNLGVALANQGKIDEAIAALSEAVRLQPQSAHAHTNLARAYTDRGRRRLSDRATAEALRDFEAAIDVQPNFPDAHHERGRLLAGFGRDDEALRALLEASRLAPGVADFHYDAAVVLVKLGRYSDALRLLEGALAVDPNHAEARAAIAEILKRRR